MQLTLDICSKEAENFDFSFNTRKSIVLRIGPRFRHFVLLWLCAMLSSIMSIRRSILVLSCWQLGHLNVRLSVPKLNFIDALTLWCAKPRILAMNWFGFICPCLCLLFFMLLKLCNLINLLYVCLMLWLIESCLQNFWLRKCRGYQIHKICR